jgi:adhesin HecA-like repeat protein
MFAKAAIGMMAGAAAVAPAHAQTFDGTYKGAFIVQKRVASGAANTECPRIGGRFPITIKVTGGTVSLTNPFATYFGTIDAGGGLQIRGSRLARTGGGQISARYDGTICGKTASGSSVATGLDGECQGKFKARR